MLTRPLLVVASPNMEILRVLAAIVLVIVAFSILSPPRRRWKSRR